MPLEWDDDKRRRNLRKHGIDFVDAKEVWSRYHVELPSNQTAHGEPRWLAVGELSGRIVTVVFTWRDTTIDQCAKCKTKREKELPG